VSLPKSYPVKKNHVKISRKISAAAVATPTPTTEEIQEYEFPFLIVPLIIFAVFVLYILETK